MTKEIKNTDESHEESLIFYYIVEKRLNIDVESFEESERLEAFDRLLNAANVMQEKVGDFTGINICTHVASSFVLLGCEEFTKYHEMEVVLKTKFKIVDPSMILVITGLYYILQRMISRLKDDQQYSIIEQKYISYRKEKDRDFNEDQSPQRRQRSHYEAGVYKYKV